MNASSREYYSPLSVARENDNRWLQDVNDCLIRTSIELPLEEEVVRANFRAHADKSAESYGGWRLAVSSAGLKVMVSTASRTLLARHGQLSLSKRNDASFTLSFVPAASAVNDLEKVAVMKH